MLYSADVTGLGNIRRTLAIAWKLSELRPDAALLAVTGSLATDAFTPPPSFDFTKVSNASRMSLSRFAPVAGCVTVPIFRLAVAVDHRNRSRISASPRRDRYVSFWNRA